MTGAICPGGNLLIGNGSKVILPRTDTKNLTEAELADHNALEEKLDILSSYTRMNTSTIFGGVSSRPASETTDAYFLRASCVTSTMKTIRSN